MLQFRLVAGGAIATRQAQGLKACRRHAVHQAVDPVIAQRIGLLVALRIARQAQHPLATSPGAMVKGEELVVVLIEEGIVDGATDILLQRGADAVARAGGPELPLHVGGRR